MRKTCRKYEILVEVDSLGDGRIIPRAAGIAARQGRIVLPNLFMTIHLYDSHLEPELEARALSLVNDEKRKVRRLLNRNREWPQDVWNLKIHRLDNSFFHSSISHLSQWSHIDNLRRSPFGRR